MDGAVVLWLSPWSFAGLQCDERFACNSEWNPVLLEHGTCVVEVVEMRKVGLCLIGAITVCLPCEICDGWYAKFILSL